MQSTDRYRLNYFLFVTFVVVGLYFTTWVNYLLFHSIVELFSVVIASTVFIITWNSAKYIRNPYLIMVGISYLFIGLLDTLHTLAYKGMPIFTDYDYYANQLWIAARYLESITLLIAFVLLLTRKTVKVGFLLVCYSLLTSLLIAGIFYWKVFPICFVAGQGLTPFKIYSEYLICGILGTSIWLLSRNRRFFSEKVFRLIVLSMLFAIISELAFTFYIDNYGISNLVGHYFKLSSFLMIYHAIVSTGIEDPYDLIFKELAQANQLLRQEVERRKETERENEQAAQSLRESEEKFRSLFETMPDAVLQTWGDGRIITANPAACSMFRMPLPELILKGRDGLLCSDAPAWEAVDGKGEAGRVVNAELCYLRRDGERFTAETDTVTLPGSPARSFVILRDISRRKQTEAALKELNEELEKRVAERTAELREKDQLLLTQGRFAAMGEMIGNIAHQWRQPLNSLGLLVQEAQLVHEVGEADQGYMAEYVQKSMNLIHHMSRTIDDFRNFFKPDKEKVRFGVEEVIGKTLQLLEGSFKEQGVAVEVSAQPEAELQGYPNEFSQVLLNILNNARDVLRERGVDAPKIVIEVATEGGKVRVSIRDNGGGIDPGIIGRIFDPYFTTKRPKDGTGVGLSMSRSIIEKNFGGALSARNVAEGAEFRIEVEAPVAAAGDDDNPEATRAGESQAAS